MNLELLDWAIVFGLLIVLIVAALYTRKYVSLIPGILEELNNKSD